MTEHIPIIQRTKDGSYSRIDRHYYVWVKGRAIERTREQFIRAVREQKLETCDLVLIK